MDMLDWFRQFVGLASAKQNVAELILGPLPPYVDATVWIETDVACEVDLNPAAR